MTTEAQRIKIAEACGWTHCQPDKHYGHDRPKGVKPNGKEQRSTDWEWLPDYLNDLNAMHEAEKVLTPIQRFDYSNHLETALDLIPEGQGLGLREHRNFTYAHATANQRAEAFLKCLGLWKD